jgi:hypothetical protein
MKTCDREELMARFEKTIDFVESCHEHRKPLHEIEKGIFDHLLELGRMLLGMLFALYGDGDQGERLKLDDGRELRRLKEPHKRKYFSIFGVFELFRAVYGTREKQKIEWVPLDAQLSLPESKFSYLLQEWDQELAVNEPYAKVNDVIRKIFGFDQSVNSLERTNRKMSESVEAYWEQQTAPSIEEEGALMVIQADGKGVVIRSESDAGDLAQDKPLKTKKKEEKKEKNGKKKMALVGAAYTIDPYVRTPQAILDALFRKPCPAEKTSTVTRPKPVAKHVRASLMRDDQGTMAPSYKEIYDWLRREVALRDPESTKPLICVMDGQTQLWDTLERTFPDVELVQILDIIHATSYVWEAAHLFYDKGSSQAVGFAKERILRLLKGEVDGVIRGLRWMGTHEKLPKKQKEELEKVCGYFENNRHRMAYDKYLAAGYPIASGVIEGACRNIIVDRMEHSGMRWVVNGAHSMLQLRCVKLSDAWDDFMQFRFRSECERLYPGYAANDETFAKVA